MDLQVDENLIAATLRLIDGGIGHHYHSTVHIYREAARRGNTTKVAECENNLRRWIVSRTQEIMPDAYRQAIAKLCQATTDGVPCGKCGNYKVHGQKCPGNGTEPCWDLREPCDHHDGKCCRCAGHSPT